MTVYVHIYGKGEPLVLFHGWGFDSKVWLPLIAGLNKYQLYLVDLPGFGGSSYIFWEEFKKLLLPQLPDKFTILGWSMGGLFATRLSVEEPDRVSKLINVASSPKFINAHDWAGIDNEVFAAFYEQLLVNPHKTRMDFIKNQLQTSEIPDNLFQSNLNMSGLQGGLEVLLSWDLRHNLISIKQPVLYVFGKLDAIVPRRVMRIMKESYPQFAYEMFDRAAHMPFLSHYDRFIKLLDEFII